MRQISFVLLCLFFASPVWAQNKKSEGCEVIVLGIAQDAGFPQAGCRKACCAEAWTNPDLRRFASCVAIVDHESGERWLLDCTPDFREQHHLLDELVPTENGLGLNGIFLTHAHIGHYTGLIHLGREVIGADGINVYVMPRMKSFLESNGPWDQLVKLNNISLQPIQKSKTVRLNERISVTPIQVPHRDEYSETVGFVVSGPNKKVLYLPDIDKWSRWSDSIENWIEKVDVALLDGTFFANGEIPGRDMAQIPHPFVEESVAQFSSLPRKQRERVWFIHLNHTNPAINANSQQRRQLKETGMKVAEQGDRIQL